MTPIQERALEFLIPSTHSPIDGHLCLAAIAYAREKGIETEVKSMILDRRLDWLNWQTRTQRQWQQKTRNPNKAVHHDSIAIRERYVRVKPANWSL